MTARRSSTVAHTADLVARRIERSDVTAIFRINENDVPWFEYEDAIRVKALTRNVAGVPPVQSRRVRAGAPDPIHSHDTDEFFIVNRR